MTDTAKPKDAGWNVGVRTTVDAPVATAWRFLLGEGLPIWLGEIDALPTEKKAPYVTRDGVRGSILAYTENSRVRVQWKPDDWPHETTLQLSLKETDAGTTVAIAHEQLADREERKMMLGHWKRVLEVIASSIR